MRRVDAENWESLVRHDSESSALFSPERVCHSEGFELMQSDHSM